jgi:hypothetical protein
MPGIHDRRRRRAFAVMLLPLATIAVHQLRYALDYGTARVAGSERGRRRLRQLARTRMMGGMIGHYVVS